mmetsp:Transcript_2107/g.6355  ORF Transcript_2107/g.6355 Transcript_2107/m.6355 type:complete len:250 (-) Transcript_2107:1175-1924(-)|eukprot:CAMPEP_0118853368 /NCGR_PEP_ID=MMETSP1163-20130328/1982_1 /TAXON_ID=124430 /ORGANISM="Phaeomonas parva, Strain CCMP2877" /LENGTH=249 /DNA_ID=CAMNT_0006785911 /DNA_START=251 /DNA_END=1000 /DNA_ORIENTATION=+
MAREACDAGAAGLALLGLAPSKVLFVTAHPDDETLFFAPAILTLAELGMALSLLCLSTGDYDGLGERRVQELYDASAALGLPRDMVRVVDDGALRDGWDAWGADEVAGFITRHVSETAAQAVVTFDAGGVSGHPNHRSLFHGVAQVLQEPGAECGPGRRAVEVFTLATVSTLRKFLGLIEFAYEVTVGGGRRAFLRKDGLEKVWTTMWRWHRSQWTWYRQLFVLFSRYTYMSDLGHAGRICVDEPRPRP